MSEILEERRVKSTANYKPYLFNDHFQNYKRYNIPKAQLISEKVLSNIQKKLF